MNERLREMREHVGVDPYHIVANPHLYNRSDRRLAARVAREQDDIREGLRQSAAGETVDLGSFIQYAQPERTGVVMLPRPVSDPLNGDEPLPYEPPELE